MDVCNQEVSKGCSRSDLKIKSNNLALRKNVIRLCNTLLQMDMIDQEIEKKKASWAPLWFLLSVPVRMSLECKSHVKPVS